MTMQSNCPQLAVIPVVPTRLTSMQKNWCWNVLLVSIIGAGVHGLSVRVDAADSASKLVLTTGGKAKAAIVIGKDSGPFFRWLADEVQRHVQALSYAKLPIVTHDKIPAEGALILLGGPQVNPLSATAQREQLVNFHRLKPEGFILRSIKFKGRPAVVVGGNEQSATMYAAYEFLERLGMVFQLTGDIIPEQKPDLGLPALDVRMEPVVKVRGILDNHAWNFHMGLQDYRKLIDQMAKLKLNVLEFSWGIGSPWLEISYNGKIGELTTTPESGYLAWGRDSRSWGHSPHSTTGSGKDVRVGREAFPQDYIGAPEFATARTQDDARRTAREFLRELIQYAHQRHVQVYLLLSELSFVPPNLANASADGVPFQEANSKDEYTYQRYCGVALSPSDPRTLGIWDAAMRSLIETYPQADSFGFWTTEHSPDMRDPQISEILRQNAEMRAKLPTVEEIRRRGNVIVTSPDQLDSDFLQMYLSAELIKRIKKHHPDAKLGIMTLFRGYKLAVMDQMLPKDVWLGNMEQCATTGPVMDFYRGISGRDLFVVPRINDDGDELHLQLNTMEYDQDEIITGAAKHSLAGVVGQSLHYRNGEYNVRFLADGAWNSQIHSSSFYESYLTRLYGTKALSSLLKAFRLLEENEKAMVYWGRCEIFRAFKDFSPLEQFRTNVDFRAATPTIYRAGPERVNAAEDQRASQGETKLDRQELVRSINASWSEGLFWKWRQALAPEHAASMAQTEGEFYQRRADQCREALALLREARGKVSPGSRAELEYVIYKTDGMIDYFDVLTACYDATITLDRAWLGLIDGDWGEFGNHLNQCRVILERAHRLARASAGQMLAYADDPTEKYLLLRYNRNVIASIETSQKYVNEVIAFQLEHGATNRHPAGK